MVKINQWLPGVTGRKCNYKGLLHDDCSAQRRLQFPRILTMTSPWVRMVVLLVGHEFTNVKTQNLPDKVVHSCSPSIGKSDAGELRV